MLLVSLSFSTSSAIPFASGERLTFDVSWYGVNGGTSVFEVSNAVYDNKSVIKISTTLKSNSVISLFYPVKDVVESYVDMKNLQPYRYRSRQQEGSYRSDKEIVFNREKNLATFIHHKSGGKTHVSETAAGVHDPLSVVYFLRTIPLAAGQSVNIDVYDGTKNWTVVFQGVAKEKVVVPAGTFDTIKVKTLIKFEGLFVNKGEVFIWFTDDEVKIPVKMESKIKVGTITALLTEKQGTVHSSY